MDDNSDELSKYPNLARYYRHFEEHHGEGEVSGWMPKLITWIRTIVEPDEGEWIDPVQAFGMEEYDAEEFCSWGHNSRWWNVFWPFAASDMERTRESCLLLAEKHGDPNVDERYDNAGKQEK